VLFIVQHSVRSCYFLHAKKSSFVMQSTLMGLSLNILANMLLVPQYGVYGAAIGTVLSHFLTGILSSLFLKEKQLFKVQAVALWPDFKALKHHYSVIKREALTIS